MSELNGSFDGRDPGEPIEAPPTTIGYVTVYAEAEVIPGEPKTESEEQD